MKHHESKVNWIEVFYESAVGWWGESRYNSENLRERLELIQEYGDRYDKRVLELGAGTGETASYLCDHGYSVTAVDICKKNIELVREMRKKRPSLMVVEDDFFKVTIEEKFPTICMFEAFGLGSDKDQRELLKRIKKNLATRWRSLNIGCISPFRTNQSSRTKTYLG